MDRHQNIVPDTEEGVPSNKSESNTDMVKQHVIHLETGQLSTGGHDVEFTGRQFGTVQGLDEQGRHILNPQPSDSPDDPLNWSWRYKQYLAGLACVAVLLCNITGAGPTVAIVPQSIEWWGPELGIAKIGDTAYLFNGTSLANGISLFFWVPAITKWGRRPMYILAFAIYLVCCIWSGVAKSFASELTGRIILGLASGAGECLGALTITDIFFSHERGLYMAYYNVFLSSGSALGIITDGAIYQHTNSWRNFYWVATGVVGAALVLVIFTFPETSFRRNNLMLNGHAGQHLKEEDRNVSAPAKKTYLQSIAIYNGAFTDESYFKVFIRPWGIVWLPAVFYAMLVWGATIGILVAVTSNVANAYQTTYGFTVQDCGFLFWGALVGSLVGIPAGGMLGDYCSEWGARRNNGVREPEHRLVALLIPIITAPLSTTLYGACIYYKWNWFIGCLGISLVNFNISSATNVAMVYAIDCYKPISDEVVTAILGFKAVVGFVIGFYANQWVDNQGYLNAFGQMAAIEEGLLLLSVPMYFYGKRLRQGTARWPIFKWCLTWDDDRDDLKVE